MTLQQFVQKNQLSGFDFYSELKAWSRPIHSINLMQWQLIYKRLIRSVGLDKANKSINEAKEELLRAYLMGEMDRCALLDLPIKYPASSVQEMAKILSPFSQMEISLFMFALSEKMSVKEAVLLKWNELSERAISDLGKQILDNVVRHFRFDYVFWKFGKFNRPLPMVGSESHFSETTGMTWKEFSTKANNIHCPTLSKQVKFHQLLDK